MNSTDLKYQVRFFIFILFFITFLPNIGITQEKELDINWISGPTIAELGKIAQIEIDESYLFADGNDSRKAMEYMGNPASNLEVGMIIPNDQNNSYYILFEYSPIGYIKDDEKNQIDKDAILENLKKGTLEANKTRKEKGFSSLNIIGWFEEPHYDVQSNNLVWAILAESDGKQVVNYNTRLLGRSGVMSTVLVTDPETLASDKMAIEQIISKFSYKKGNKYAEWTKGDKVAKIGLTALIGGGAATVAAKTGFFKMLLKSGKLVILGIIAFFAAIWKKIKSIVSNKSGENT